MTKWKIIHRLIFSWKSKPIKFIRILKISPIIFTIAILLLSPFLFTLSFIDITGSTKCISWWFELSKEFRILKLQSLDLCVSILGLSDLISFSFSKTLIMAWIFDIHIIVSLCRIYNSMTMITLRNCSLLILLLL